MSNAHTPLEEQKKHCLRHYREISKRALESHSAVPKAIEHYYDSLIRRRDSEKHMVGFAWVMVAIFLVTLGLTLLTSWLYS